MSRSQQWSGVVTAGGPIAVCWCINTDMSIPIYPVEITGQLAAMISARRVGREKEKVKRKEKGEPL